MTHTKEEALKLALEVLETGWSPTYTGLDAKEMGIKAITAIKQALAAPVQDMPKIGCVNHDCDKCKAAPVQEEDLYDLAVKADNGGQPTQTQFDRLAGATFDKRWYVQLLPAKR